MSFKLNAAVKITAAPDSAVMELPLSSVGWYEVTDESPEGLRCALGQIMREQYSSLCAHLKIDEQRIVFVAVGESVLATVQPNGVTIVTPAGEPR